MFRVKEAFALIVLATTIATAKAMAQDSANHSIGTHQIDRFEAIHLLQESLKSTANDAAAWIVLVELAYEVAQDLSPRTTSISKLSQEADQMHSPCSRKTPGRGRRGGRSRTETWRCPVRPGSKGCPRRSTSRSGRVDLPRRGSTRGPSLFTSDASGASGASGGRRGNQFRPGPASQPAVIQYPVYQPYYVDIPLYVPAYNTASASGQNTNPAHSAAIRAREEAGL